MSSGFLIRTQIFVWMDSGYISKLGLIQNPAHTHFDIQLIAQIKTHMDARGFASTNRTSEMRDVPAKWWDQTTSAVPSASDMQSKEASSSYA